MIAATLALALTLPTAFPATSTAALPLAALQDETPVRVAGMVVADDGLAAPIATSEAVTLMEGVTNVVPF